MAGSKSAYLEATLINWLLGGAAAPAPGAAVFIALSTAAYSTTATGAAMTEVSSTGTGYARVSVTRSTANFPGATGNNPASTNNATAFTFPAATAAQGTATSFYIVDAASGGNIYWGADLTTPKAINTGDTATFAASALVVTEQ